jgi:hypothetical protein
MKINPFFDKLLIKMIVLLKKIYVYCVPQKVITLESILYKFSQDYDSIQSMISGVFNL